MRPAPIQVMWLGYPGTSGASYMDYVIIMTILDTSYTFDTVRSCVIHILFLSDNYRSGDISNRTGFSVFRKTSIYA